MIVVTGATGFIGSVLLWELNERGYKDILISDHVPPSVRSSMMAKRKYSQFVFAKDLITYLQALKKPPEYVFHLGACSSTTEMNVAYLRENNTAFSARIFSLCTELNIPLQYASSGAVYGDGSQGFDDETPSSKFKPLNPYGWSKLNFDLQAPLEIAQPPHWLGLRFFNVYGPNEYHKDDMASVVFKAFHQIKEKGVLKLFKSHHPDYSDGGQMRDFVYVKDITNWMVNLMQKPEPIASGIYNMGFGKARTWLNLAEAIFESMGKPVNIEWIPIPQEIRNQYQYFTEAKMDKLKLALIGQPQWPLEKGIEDYVVNYLDQEDKYL
ncbi:MAG: ADP-glyceromanno-heptose 6-epimerase [Bdellovibrionales bacterium]|nr:ADP-glyceromanno-heptose 6-epimerase [Bdellovibrionales bacterium]